MCEEHLGQCFAFRALHRLPSHSSVFTFYFPSFNFFFAAFERDIISQSVVTWLEIFSNFFWRNFRNALSILAESQAGNFLYPAASMPIW